jgi:Cof subfamily protein (haloacid dehalogenase superfamily)
LSRFRLLALDIDGTLLSSARVVSERTRRAILAARAEGVLVVLVTGRRHPAARRVAEELGGDVPLVLHNGALIISDGEVLRCVPLPREAARTAIRLGLRHGADPVVHCGRMGEGRLLVQGVSESNTLLAYYLERSHPDVSSVDDLEHALPEEPIQVMFGGAIGEMDALRSVLAAGLGESARVEPTFYPRRQVALLDVLDRSVDKAEALAFLQERWGVGPGDVLAIGDNWNDREMLKRAGLGLVMGNADAEMLGLGLPILPTNDEDGVAHAIERYILES